MTKEEANAAALVLAEERAKTLRHRLDVVELVRCGDKDFVAYRCVRCCYAFTIEVQDTDVAPKLVRKALGGPLGNPDDYVDYICVPRAN